MLSQRMRAAQGLASTAGAAAGEADAEGVREARLVRAGRRREKREARAQAAEWWSTKLHALLWVAGAAVALVTTNFVDACMNSPFVNRAFFNAGGVLFLLVTCGVLRMAFWFPKNTHDADEDSAELERKHPWLVVGTTFGGILSFVLLSIGLWPVYRIFAPFLLILFWFGLIMSLHFMP